MLTYIPSSISINAENNLQLWLGNDFIQNGLTITTSNQERYSFESNNPLKNVDPTGHIYQNGARDLESGDAITEVVNFINNVLTIHQTMHEANQQEEAQRYEYLYKQLYGNEDPYYRGVLTTDGPVNKRKISLQQLEIQYKIEGKLNNPTDSTYNFPIPSNLNPVKIKIKSSQRIKLDNTPPGVKKSGSGIVERADGATVERTFGDGWYVDKVISTSNTKKSLNNK